MKNKLIFIYFVWFTIFTANVIYGQQKRYITKKYKKPKCAHMVSELRGVKVKKIRGTLVINNNPQPNSIVSLYKIGRNKTKFISSYMVGSDGKFDFKGLKQGQYFLETGTIDGAFNCLNIKVLLAPEDEDSLSEDLEIPMEVGT